MINDFTRGDTKNYKLVFTSNGNPVPMFGSKIYFTMKVNETDADNVAALQVLVVPEDTPDSASGIVMLVLDSNKTDIEPGSYLYDIQQSIPGEEVGDPPIVTTLVSGRVNVLADITRTN